jgi:hypothetical protein
MHIRTVRRWIADGALTSSKLGGARLVAMADLDAVLSSFGNTPQAVSDRTREYVISEDHDG